MNPSAQAQASREARPAASAQSVSELRRQRATTKLPGEEMTIAETLRVMDVAREMRQQRETAEEMFRSDEVRIRLREKLLRTAALSGDRVTAAEIDVAIDQYLANLHTYESPPPGLRKFLAYCWIWRYRITALALAAGACGWLFL